MFYRKRIVEKKVLEASKFFKIILITGARQVGKSSLLGHLFPSLKNFVFNPIQVKVARAGELGYAVLRSI